MSSDETSSRVTYTSISSDYEEPYDVGSPGVFVYGYDGLPMHPIDLPSRDHVPGLEEPEQAPLSPDSIPGLEYPEYLALSDEESEDGPTDYSADGGDDDDDDDESSGDDVDDEDEEEASKEDGDEEEHLALADSITVASLVVDPVPSAEETEPFETDKSAATPPPPPAYCTTARMSIRAQTPIPFPSEAEVNKLLAIPTPPPSLLALLSSPLPQIPLPPFPVPLPPTTSPTYTKAPLGYRAAEIRLRTASPPPFPLSSPLPLPPHIILPRTRASMVLMRVVAPSTYILLPRSRAPPSGIPPILPIPLPTSSSTRGFRADYGFVGTLDAEIRRDTDKEVGYEITDVWVDPAETVEEIPLTTLAELSQRVTDFVTNVRDRRYHANTALLVKREAKVAREAWAQYMDAIHKARSKVRALQTHIVVLQRQRIEDSDMLTQHIQHEHDRFKEFQRTRDVAPEDADSSS
ncbi:hypothetical protein Tco_1164548 [Tanacetum coccineum]